MLRIDLMRPLIKKLGKQGWKRRQGDLNPSSNPILLRNQHQAVIVATSIPCDPEKEMLSEVDDYFREVIERIKRDASIKLVFLPGGGAIQMPQFFLDLCNELGIEIRIIDERNYKDFSTLLFPIKSPKELYR